MYDVYGQKWWWLYVMPDLVSVFPFPQILFLQYSQKIALQATFLILSQLSPNEFDIKSLGNRPAVVFFNCSQISFENANHAKDKKTRRTSSQKFSQRIICLSTKIKAPSEKYLRSL